MKKMSLSDLEKKYGLSSGTLRYYDQKGILPIFQRKESGQRYVDEADISSVELLIMLKLAGCSLKTIKTIQELSNKSRSSTLEERKENHRMIAEILDENTNQRLDDMAMLSNQIRSSRYLSWFFAQSAKEGSTLIHTKESAPKYKGTIPDELKRFLTYSQEKTKNQTSMDTEIDDLITFLEKYPNYIAEDEEV